MAVSQEDLQKAIDEIAEKGGLSSKAVTTRMVVDAARNENHILHDEFDWNDASAADKHRLAVAASLIRKYQYVGFDVKREPIVARGYVYSPPSRAYVPLSRTIQDAKRSHALLLSEISAITGRVRSAQRIADVLFMRQELDRALHNVIDELLFEIPAPGAVRKVVGVEEGDEE